MLEEYLSIFKKRYNLPQSFQIIRSDYFTFDYSGFPHNFDLEIPGHFQDFSRTCLDIFQDIFPDFCMQLNSKTSLPRLFCCAIHNIITVYNTKQVHRRKVWVPTAGRGVRAYHPHEKFAILCTKMMHFGVFWKNSRTFPGHFCKMFKFQDFSRTFPQIFKFQDFSRTSLNSRTQWEP